MATEAKDITPPKANGGLSRQVSSSLGASLSSSPSLNYRSLGYSGASAKIGPPNASAKQLKPFNTQDIKILLLENVNQVGREALQKQGYQVEYLKSSLSENELISKIR